MKRILLATTGSLGDLHPILAIALGLRERGHTAVIATSNVYREKVMRAGLEFAAMGPHLPTSSDFVREVFHPRKGPELLIRQVLYPSVPSAYAEVVDALRGCDLVVTHPITFAAQIAAEKLGLPWVSTVTATLSLPSRYDPPVFGMMPVREKLLLGWGPGLNGVLLSLGQATTNPWLKPIAEFRASLGMPPGKNPLFDGQHSPQRALAMFSSVMAEPQPDWPRQVRVIGFPFYDQAEHGEELDPELERFLNSGPPPVVFTLGSSAVHDAGTFYQESLAAVKRLGCRAVLLAGANAVAGPLPAGTAVFAYAPYSQILPRAAAVVHQGGMGTCGQALAAGRPMLVMPYAFDQPDNAARLDRLGVARVIRRKDYTAKRAAAELDRLRSDARYGRCAAEAGRRVRAEDAVAAACYAVEECLGRRSAQP